MSRFNLNEKYLNYDFSNITNRGISLIKDYIFSDLLDNNDKIKSIYLSNLHISDVFVVANEAERLALNAQEGDFCRQTDTLENYIYGDTGWIDINNEFSLSTLNDVIISYPTDYHYIFYDTPSGKWKNRIMQLSACNDIYFPTLPVENDFLRFSGGVWRHIAVDIKTDMNSLNDVLLTSVQNGDFIIYNSGNFINIPSSNYLASTLFFNHTNDLSIHRDIGEPTPGYCPVGNGAGFDTSLLQMSLLDDCTIGDKYEGHKLMVNSSGNFINTFSEKTIIVSTSRLLNDADEGSILYCTTGPITLIIPMGLIWETHSIIRIKSKYKVILRTNEGVVMNGKFDEIHGKDITLIKISLDTYQCDYDDDESSFYKTIATSPNISDIIDTTKSVEHSSVNMSNIVFAYSSASSGNRVYVNYNIAGNTIANTASVASYNSSFSDILNINNTFYSFQCNGSALICAYSPNNYATKTENSILASGIEIVSRRIFYSFPDSAIVVPYINSFDKFYVCFVSLDFLTITTKDCNIVLPSTINMFAGYHFGRSVLLAQGNTNYIKILVDKNSNSFMNDPTNVSIDVQLGGSEHLMEARRTGSGDRFIFLTRDISNFNIYSITDTYDGIMKLYSIPGYSEVHYSPGIIRDEILYIPINSQYSTNMLLAGYIEVDMSNYKVKRNVNMFDRITNQNYFSFLVRRAYGCAAIGLPYNNTGGFLYKNII